MQTPVTGARSRLSDFGSLETGLVSQDEDNDDAVLNNDDITEDLDSLDDGLHAFNEPSDNGSARPMVDQGAQTVLPTHDGLGAFPGSSSPVQEQFWHHERYNPRRRRQSLRRSSLQQHFDALESHEPQRPKHDRFARVEKWRLEQSQAIMHEIERESRRRRRRSRLSITSSQPNQSCSSVSRTRTQERPSSQTQEQTPVFDQESETVLGRFTRQVIKGLLGLDDATLSYLFGEALPVTTKNPTHRKPNVLEAVKADVHDSLELSRLSETWEERLLARIAKELDGLVNCISDHPGAFTAYLRVHDPPSYAGLPTPADLSGMHDRSSSARLPTHLPKSTSNLKRKHVRRQSSIGMTDPSLFGIEEEPTEHEQVQEEKVAEAAQLQKEREYWERDLDVKMVFNYLRDRISSSSRPVRTSAGAPHPKPVAAAAASSVGPESLRRATLIRHQHPLVSRNLSSRASSILQPSLILGRRASYTNDDEIASSCASQSTKRSKTYHSGSLSLGSSRNYWDIGGSIGSAGGLGSGGVWGEV